MRPWAWVRRILALAVTIVFVLGVAVAPAFAAKGSRSFSSPPRSITSGGRSFSTPKTKAPSAPSRSFSSPKTTAPSAPSRSFSSPAPPSVSTPSPSYSSPDRSFSSGDRSYSSEDRSFSSQRPMTNPLWGAPTPSAPPPTYDTSRTNYPSLPPIVVYGPSTYDPTYWHDWYYARPWYWRMWHRPVYYGDSGGWAVNWLSILLVAFGIWVLLGYISAKTSRRRKS